MCFADWIFFCMHLNTDLVALVLNLLILIAGAHSTISTDINLVMDQNSKNMLPGLTFVVNNTVELSSNSVQKDIQSDHLNCFLSSEFPEPERMRFAASGYTNFLTDMGQQTTEKGIVESDGSVDRVNSLSGQKRHLVDSTPSLQNDISPKMSGILRKKRNNDYIPHDDDLLASILGINHSNYLILIVRFWRGNFCKIMGVYLASFYGHGDAHAFYYDLIDALLLQLEGGHQPSG